MTRPDQPQPVLNCPHCQCRELFVRRDFPQKLGLGIVIAAAVAATVLFAIGQVLWALAIMLATALVDACILLFVGKVVVCYRCRAEFRGVPIGEGQHPWDLATGEKYRQQVKMPADAENDTSHRGA